MDTVELGRTGLSVSRLAFGTGTHGWAGSSEQTGLELDGLADLLRLAYDHGVTLWDAADAYGSHPHVARALQGIPRDKVMLMTKTTSQDGDRVTRDVDRFLRELDTNVLDVVLLHFMTQSDWPHRYAGAMEALSRAQEQGKVRAVGVSCHGLGPLRAAAASDWVEVVLARINSAGASMSASPSEVVPIIKEMYASGKAICGIKVLGCGQLAHKARAAIRYVLQLGTVHSLVIGTSSRKQLLENVRLVEELAPRHPLHGL
jgi:aryl-alcohol dehydrogenase-like predicted oxidoreductase